MAKSINQAGVRDNLAPRREPYWQPLGRGRSVGFRKMSEDTQGAWIGRWRDEEARKYEYKPLGDLAQTANKDRYAEAVRQLEEWFRHLEQGGQAGDDTVAAVCAAYVSKVRLDPERNAQAREAAARDAERRFERLVNHDPIGKMPVDKLKDRHTKAWRERLLAGGGSVNTINREMTALRAALNLALDDRKVSNAFAWSRALRPIEVDQSEFRRELYLDPGQRQSLIEHASKEFRALVVAWNLLPVRPGEIAACQVHHLDVKERMLKIPRGKTKARQVPLTDEAFEHFRECAKGKTPAAWLVARADGGRWTSHRWSEHVRAAASKAGLPGATIAYTLRHSTITDLVTGGVDIFTVAKLSGTSVAMIDKFYGKLLNAHARKALSILSLK